MIRPGRMARALPMRSARLPLVIAVLLACQLFPAARAAGAMATPQQIVRQFQDSLLAAMKEGGGYASRYRLLEPAVRRAFDFEDVARVALGRYWLQLTPEQRAAFADVFAQLSAATYSARFNVYSGEHFTEPKPGKVSGGRAIVHSDLVDAEDEVVPFTYQLRETEGAWCIVNVIASGVSDLAVKRAEYSDIIRNEGFDALLDRLRQKVAQYGGGDNDGGEAP